MRDVYSPGRYYARCRAVVERIGKPVATSRVSIDDLVITARAVARIGILSARRRHFWRLLARAALRGSHALRRAITHALLQTPRETPDQCDRRRVVRLPIAAAESHP
jgi:Domain of unknown function (DUF4070)